VTLTGNAPNLNGKATLVPAGIYDDTVTVDNPAIQITNKLALSGGVLYDLVITGTAQNSLLIVTATGLNEQPSSAPTAAGSAVAQANTPATQQAQPTQAATAAAAAPTQAPAPSETPVPAPDVPATAAPPPATEAATSAEVVPDTPTPSGDVVQATDS